MTQYLIARHGTGKVKSSADSKLSLIALMCCLLTLMTGCASPAYFGQAVTGHLAIMSSREDITTVLESGQIDAELRSKLILAMEIRAFASSELGLPDNDSYRQFVHTGRVAVTWNVLATPEFSLEPKRWCFLVAGCVPYRGYFKQESARKFAEHLRGQSLDVTISPAIAYSTLGWFDDPLLDTMLQYREEQLAGIIFHELAHQQLYIKGDTAFNESYASFVEEIGVTIWLTSQGQDEILTRWRSMSIAGDQFNVLLAETREQLRLEFRSGNTPEIMKARKQAIYSGLRVQYGSLVENEWNGSDYFHRWFERDLNNARLALAESYQGGLCAFKNLYQHAGKDIVRFQRLAAEKKQLSTERRKVWLNQSCEPTLAGR